MRILFGSIATALITTAAVADGNKDQTKQSAAKFETLDRNDDGRLSKSEARTEDTLSAQFASIDQDSDGYVSESEYTALADTRSSQPSEPSDMERQSPDESRTPY